MKRPNRSHGILVTMLGITMGLFGIMYALIFARSNWTLAWVGLATCFAGVVMAIQGERPDHGRERAERRMPKTRVVRR